MENSANLESEIADIERRLAEKKAAWQQTQGEAVPEASDRAVLHEVVGEKINELSPPGLPSAAPAQAPPVLPPPITDPPSYLSDDLRDQVQQLVNIAFTKSLTDAIKEVGKIDNPALLDAFHDVLVDQLYDVLVERGKLEKI